MRLVKPIRLVWGLFALYSVAAACAQDSEGSPLGDLARSLRKKPASVEKVQKVIDNDNMSQVLDDGEVQSRAGTPLIFSVDPSANQFRASSPDVTCSLSFSAKATSLITDPSFLQELPATELAKLDGPATMDGDALQITVSNGSQWSVRELTISLTTVRYADPNLVSPYFGQARLLPATADMSVSTPTEKRQDLTVLYRVHRDIPASRTAVVRTSLTVPPGPGQEWHWAIVRAKGSAPAVVDAASSAATVDPGKALAPRSEITPAFTPPR